MTRRIIGDGRVLLLTLLLGSSAAALQPRPELPALEPAGIELPAQQPSTRELSTPEPSTPELSTPVQDTNPATDATVLLAELEELAAELMIPVQGIAASDLRDNFNEMRGSRRHEALDILAPRDTPVISVTAGRVLQISSNGAGGRMVFAADSSERFLFLYAHLEDYAGDLEEGMPLRRGQVLGYVGTSGNAPSDTPHLHFAIKRAGKGLRWSRGIAIDPRPLYLPRQVPDPLLDQPFPETPPSVQ